MKGFCWLHFLPLSTCSSNFYPFVLFFFFFIFLYRPSICNWQQITPELSHLGPTAQGCSSSCLFTSASQSPKPVHSKKSFWASQTIFTSTRRRNPNGMAPRNPHSATAFLGLRDFTGLGFPLCKVRALNNPAPKFLDFINAFVSFQVLDPALSRGSAHPPRTANDRWTSFFSFLWFYSSLEKK